MGTIVVSGPQNITLDGVVQDPDGLEGWEHGGWFVRHIGEDRSAWNQVALDEALAASAWLLGRASYQFFATRWMAREGELADRLRTIPKHVVSNTLTHPEWLNTSVLAGPVVEAVRQLKDEVDGEIVVPASRRLVQSLLAADLVDELRLVIFPVVIGSGERLLANAGAPLPFRLIESRPIGDGLVHVTYRFERSARTEGLPG